MAWRAVRRPPGSARRDLTAEVRLPAAVVVEGVEDAVLGVADLERVPGHGARFGGGEVAPALEELPRSSPLPGLASSSASTPNVGLIGTPWMSLTYVSKRLIGSGGAATLSIVSDVDVAVLAVDDCFDSGLSAVVDVLATANASDRTCPHRQPAFTVTIVGLKRQVRTGNGLTVNPVSAKKMAQRPDLLVMPALGSRRPRKSSTPSVARSSTSSASATRTAQSWLVRARELFLGRVRRP